MWFKRKEYRVETGERCVFRESRFLKGNPKKGGERFFRHCGGYPPLKKRKRAVRPDAQEAERISSAARGNGDDLRGTWTKGFLGKDSYLQKRQPTSQNRLRVGGEKAESRGTRKAPWGGKPGIVRGKRKTKVLGIECS